MSALDRFFHQISTLPPAPRVVGDLLARLEDSDVDLRDIAQLVSRDPVLVAKMLRMANSSYYGVSGTVGSVDDAIKLLGLNQVQVIVITCSVASAFAQIKGFSLTDFWRKSFLVALIARALAARAGQNAGVAFTAGLMHAMGQLMIHTGFPQAGAELEVVAAEGDFRARRAAEEEVLGTDHCQIGAELARRWNFPAPIIEAIEFYAQPTASGAGPLARVVFVAAVIAHAIERKEDVALAIAGLPPEVTAALALDPDKLTAQIEGFRALVSEVAQVLG
jgi:HD-like signal output (HDOD) protein